MLSRALNLVANAHGIRKKVTGITDGGLMSYELAVVVPGNNMDVPSAALIVRANGVLRWRQLDGSCPRAVTVIPVIAGSAVQRRRVGQGRHRLDDCG